MNIIKSFIKPTQIDGNNLDVKIKVGYEWEHDVPEIEDYDIMLQLETGDLQNVKVIVDVYYNGQTGSDSLGQCVLPNSNFERRVMEIVNSYDMIQMAINDLTSQFKRIYDKKKEKV